MNALPDRVPLLAAGPFPSAPGALPRADEAAVARGGAAPRARRAARPRSLGRSVLASVLLHGAALSAGVALARAVVATPPRALLVAFTPCAESLVREDVPDAIEPVEDVFPEVEETPLPEPPPAEVVVEPDPPPPEADPPAPPPELLPFAAPRDPARRTRPPPPPPPLPPRPSPARPVLAPPSGGVVEDAVPHGTNRPPAYPVEAQRRGWRGDVVLLIHVSASGVVEELELEVSSGYAILDAAVLDAVRTWRFSPATEDGRPVARAVRRRFRFQR